MLSYRHAFHAGNHADVLKHFVLQQVIEYTKQKDKPFWYIDTHAGAGLYALNTGYAMQNAEYKDGIDKLIAADKLPSALQDFVSLITQFNTNPSMRLYPGSPAIAQQLIRADDKMRLFELHPNDYKFLAENFKGNGRQTKVEMQNGFAGLKAILPPPSRRALVLIDPPYEDKQDYQTVISACKKALSTFETGTYMVWYPLLQRPEPTEMLAELQDLPLKNWLNVSLSISHPSANGFGMFGSGMFIINPPWTLPNILAETMPVLRDLLALDNGASFELSHQIS